MAAIVGNDRIVLVDAPAKVNLHLAIGQHRDDGYHDVTTVLLALDLCDEVLVQPALRLSVVCDPDIGIPAHANLAWRAAEALGIAAGREPDASIRVRKRIPSGAGLGGGSADAAAVLAALASWWGIDPSGEVVSEVARGLGADVPFLVGGGCALFAGRGDEPRRRLAVPPLHLAVVNPGVPAPTGAVYAALDRIVRPVAPPPDALSEALGSGDQDAVGAALHNDMTEAATGLVPEISAVRGFLDEQPGVLGTLVAGSGSSVFGLYADAASAECAAVRAEERGWWAVAARPRVTGAAASVRPVSLL